MNTLKKKQTQKFSKTTVSLIIASTLMTSSAFAEQDTELETITVTANRSAVNANDVLASQVVITRAEIEQVQAKSVLDVLATVAGIDISTSGGRGQTSSVFMRGANSDHTLVLINGIRIGSATLGSANLQQMAPELIERIEIVKGPRAALWGSDAIGGVIQIFTREVKHGAHFVSVNAGSEGYQQFGAGIGIEHGNGFTSLSVSHDESDGFDVKDDNETDDDGYSYDSLSINGQQTINDAFKVNWLAQVDQGEDEFDTSWGGNENDIKNHVWLFGADYQWNVADITNSTKFTFGQSRDAYTQFGNGIKKSEGSVFETRRDQLSLVNNAQINSQWQVNLGADLYQEELRGSATYQEQERDITGVFAHAFYNQDQLSYEFAARYDDVEGIDSEVTYNAGIGYQILDATHLSFSAGTGFKAPTFNDLYYPFSGNPDLVSETSESLEFNVKSHFDKLSVAFNVYQTNIDDLIAWREISDGVWVPMNVDEVEIQGSELGFNYQGFGGGHQLNLSYIKAEDQTTNEQLSDRAKKHASYKFNTTIADVDIYAEWQYKGERPDGSKMLDSYQLVNVGVSYSLSSKFSLQAKVNNAFDESYTVNKGYFAQERAAYFGITYQN
jgi:vitamin B12 transporter